MKRARLILIGLIALITLSCQQYGPSSRRGIPKEYTLAYEEIYGHCYDSVPYAVVALDLYSEGLTLDENHRIKGTGYNLYLSDIFVPDSLLAPGTYHSDISAEPYTFLPGRDFEGYPYGMYILNIEEDKIIQILELDSGSFAYRNDSLLFTLYYHNGYGRYKYTPTFSGTLLPWVKK